MDPITITARTVTSSSAVDVAPGASNATPAAPASALPAPEFFGDVATALATLMLKSEFVRKNLAHEERKVAEAGMKSAQDAQLKELTTEADMKFTAATERAAGQIVGGALSVASAAGAEARGFEDTKTEIAHAKAEQVWQRGDRVGPEPIRIPSNPGVAERLATDKDVGGGVGKIFEGSMDLLAAGEDHGASKADVRAKADENLANAWKSSIDDAKDARQVAQDRIGRVNDSLKSIQDTSAQTTMSAIKA